MATIFVPTLALEVLELIIGELTSTSGSPSEISRNLRSCLSASRELRHCALRRLYSHIDLSNTRTDRISELQDLIFPPAGSPLQGIGQHITSISISFTFKGQGPVYPLPSGRLAAKFNRFLDNPALLFLVSPLNGRAYNLRKLDLHVVPSFLNEHMRWDLLSQNFRDGFESLIRSPQLISLSLGNVKYLPPTLLNGTKLECVGLSCCFDNPTPGSTETPPEKYPFMQTLYTDHSHSLDAMGAFNHLRGISVCNSSPRHCLQTKKMVMGARHTLKRIQIAQQADFPMALSSVKLDQIPNLEHLRMDYDDSHNDLNFPNLLSLFHVSSPMTEFISLDLDVQYWGADPIQDQDEVLPQIQCPQWKKLADILSSAYFPSLRRVAITFTISGQCLWGHPSMNMSSNRIQNEMATTLTPYFAALAASPTITFTLKTLCYLEVFGD